MVLEHGKRKWAAAAGVLAVVILFWSPFRHLIFSVRLASSMQNLAGGATGEEFGVLETKIRRRMGSKECDALLYRSDRRPHAGALVIVAGISELGCYHPRLVALSRFLANQGLTVFTPDIAEFRNFEITAEPLDQILFWCRQAASMQAGDKTRKIGLAGISFSGTLALMAAAQPEIRGIVSYVAAIGPYSSLARCSREWFKPDPGASWKGYYPTRYYGRWVAMLSALGMVSESPDRRILEEVLRALLLQREIPPPAADLTSEGLRWYRLASMRPDLSDPELAAQIEARLRSRVYPELDPDGFLRKVRCPVFLIHGAYDDLIPPGESMELHKRLPRSHLLISPVLTHTHPHKSPLTWRQKAKTAIETLIFCFQFARVLAP